MKGLLSFFLLIGFWMAPAILANEVDPLFHAAVESFKTAWYERAEKEFGEIVAKFPESGRVPEAILLQAQSRLKLNQYEAAIELLQSSLEPAGQLMDQYYFWIAKAHLDRGDFKTAAAVYDKVLNDFPESAYRLEAIYGQASSHFSLGDYARTIELLNAEKGPFQQAIQNSTNMAWIAKGYLLLSEAFGFERDYKAAEETLQQLAKRNPGAEIEWERQNLLVRMELAEGGPAAALKRATNLVAMARSAGEPLLTSQSLRLQAEILEKSDPGQALRIYEEITQIDQLPGEEHRKALLKLVDLTANQDQITNAIRRLDDFVKTYPQDVSLDLLRLTLGELHLRQFHQMKKAGPPESLIPMLHQARAHFELLINAMTNSSYVGRAHLNRGWSLWEEGALTGIPERFVESENAFRIATERLPHSEEHQAVARLKWADCQFQRKDFAGAITNYAMLLEQYAEHPRVKAELFEPALDQKVRAAIELKQLELASEAVAKLLEWFPQGTRGAGTLLIYARELLEQGKPVQAREHLTDLLERFPKAPLVADAQLVLARTFVNEHDWTRALAQYGQWLERFTNHVARVRTEYDLAKIYSEAGDDERALTHFTGFVERHPKHELAPMAQYWVANHYYNQGNYPLAELHYESKVFFQPENPRSIELGFQARLMAGYAAFQRNGYADARGYLTALINSRNPECPVSLLPHAYFLLGEVFIKDDSPGNPGNSLTNFSQALGPFDYIVRFHPTDREWAPRAWGRIGDCNLQLASQNPALYAEAAKAYQNVIDSPLADVAIRSSAEVGLGIVLEKQAALLPSSERTALLNQSLDHYLNVVFGKRVRAENGETSNPYWIQQAGLYAGRLAESLQRDTEAYHLYKNLIKVLPSTQEIWEKRIEKLRKPLHASKTGPGV
jgi:tetratricopeptide (TPR) repeat protein